MGGETQINWLIARVLDGFDWQVEGHSEYTYAFMLDRIETIMNEKTSQQAEEEKD